MLSGIGITCFAASYMVTLGLEISRFFFQVRVRWLVMIGFTAAGLLAHSLYLWTHTQHEIEIGPGIPFSSWYDWCLVGAWILAVAYLGMAIRKPRNTLGLFILPLVMALIGMAYVVRFAPPFAREQALNRWGVLHGSLLLLGTVAAALGCAAGTMYLIQSYRLKKKLLPRPGLRLPTLEWLQNFMRRALLLSTGLVALGLGAGLILNVVRQANGENTVPWSDPIVLSSTVLFLWLASLVSFESFYRRAREGRRVAYMTLASFLFLGLVLVLVLLGQHGITDLTADTGGESSIQPGPEIRSVESPTGSGR
jgi:hypothetical protein